MAFARFDSAMSLHVSRLALALLMVAPAACSDPAPSGPAASPDPADAPPLVAVPSPPVAAATTIPVRFQGRWDADALACAGRAGEMRLTVAPDRLLFHESVARVVAVREEGDAIEVDLALEGEGESWRETRTLRLTGEDRLEVTVRDVSAMRVRCGDG